MSATRALMAALRARLGAADPLPPPTEARPVPAPPARVFPTRDAGPGDFAREAEAHTTALVGIGHVGTRYATDVVLQFQAELAVAHAAVAAELPEGQVFPGLLQLQSRVTEHREFLLRPDLGRRMNPESLETLRREAETDVDVQPIVADGLSAVACLGSGLALLEAFTRECEALGLSVGTPMCARYARVWLEDEIGQEVRARVAAILLGERPGLGTGDGLSAYLVYEPRIGKTDGQRNMMSNIHPRGTPPEAAGKRLALLAQAMIQQQTSGVELDLSGMGEELGEAAAAGYREPQPRQRLVEVAR